MPRRIVEILRAAPHDPRARRFVAAVLLAFRRPWWSACWRTISSRRVLFETPMLIAVALILGGIVLLFADRIAGDRDRYHDADGHPAAGRASASASSSAWR